MPPVHIEQDQYFNSAMDANVSSPPIYLGLRAWRTQAQKDDQAYDDPNHPAYNAVRARSEGWSCEKLLDSWIGDEQAKKQMIKGLKAAEARLSVKVDLRHAKEDYEEAMALVSDDYGDDFNLKMQAQTRLALAATEYASLKEKVSKDAEQPQLGSTSTGDNTERVMANARMHNMEWQMKKDKDFFDEKLGQMVKDTLEKASSAHYLEQDRVIYGLGEHLHSNSVKSEQTIHDLQNRINILEQSLESEKTAHQETQKSHEELSDQLSTLEIEKTNQQKKCRTLEFKNQLLNTSLHKKSTEHRNRQDKLRSLQSDGEIQGFFHAILEAEVGKLKPAVNCPLSRRLDGLLWDQRALSTNLAIERSQRKFTDDALSAVKEKLKSMEQELTTCKAESTAEKALSQKVSYDTGIEYISLEKKLASCKGDADKKYDDVVAEKTMLQEDLFALQKKLESMEQEVASCKAEALRRDDSNAAKKGMLRRDLIVMRKALASMETESASCKADAVKKNNDLGAEKVMVDEKYQVEIIAHKQTKDDLSRTKTNYDWMQGIAKRLIADQKSLKNTQSQLYAEISKRTKAHQKTRDELSDELDWWHTDTKALKADLASAERHADTILEDNVRLNAANAELSSRLEGAKKDLFSDLYEEDESSDTLLEYEDSDSDTDTWDELVEQSEVDGNW